MYIITGIGKAMVNFRETEGIYVYEGDISFGKAEVEKLYNEYLNNKNKRGNIAINPNTGFKYVWEKVLITDRTIELIS